MINSLGWQKILYNQDDDEIVENNKEFCEENNTEIFPEFSNDFIKDYFCECLING